MTTDPVTAGSHTPVETAAHLMREHDIGSLPVVDDGELIGIVTDRDIVVRCVAMGRHPAGTLVTEICSPEIHTVAPDEPIRRAASVMREHTLRRLPVTEGSRLAGMVSIGDLALDREPESPLAQISGSPPSS